MWIELPLLWIGLINGIGVPLVHLGISFVFTKMPRHFFAWANGLLREWPGESVNFYERIFRLSRWKNVLPDAGPWFGGFAKKSLTDRSETFFTNFHQETYRSEWAHWMQWFAISGFILWTPMPWAWVILVYAAFSNLPCIILQRQNRLRLKNLIYQFKKRRMP